MVVVDPSFEIDEKGRVICQSHSNYPNLIKPNKTYLEELQLETLLTCKSCSHYVNDDCYFPKSEIDKIEIDRLSRSRFQCNLCGNKIDRMLTIMQKIYFEVKFNMKMPLLCCSCYQNIKNDKFPEYLRRRIRESLLFYTPSVFLLINPYPFNLIVAFVYALSAFLLKIIIKQKFHYSLFLVDLLNGRKFYKKYFKNKKSVDLS
ncbi:MAG: hypothetical protein EAX91_04535 [Candidatus Lokiarchaeota archaeon]|nr:hypothetical protein [Candidatus Lokiarchaeota archaeon]